MRGKERAETVNWFILSQLPKNQSMELPQLPLESWENSKITLHLYLQILGKIKLKMAPRKNHWWHITLLPHPSGLTTGPVPYTDGTFQINVNMVNHRVEFVYAGGRQSSFELKDGLTVSEFYRKVMDELAGQDIRPEIKAVPYDHPCKEPFATCEEYHQYDPEYVQRFHQVLGFTARVFEKFRARYLGKVSPVQLYWHHMDLAVTRFNGQKGPEPAPGASPADRDAYSHEVISAGFWAGDENVRGAAYYSYTFPAPQGIEDHPLKPSGASWDMSSGSPMAILMYDDLRQENDPEKALLEFLETTYQAGAKRAKWPEESLIYTIP